MAGAETTSASDDHLNELAISIRRRFEGVSLPSDCCIFTVPVRLRQTDEEAYTPRVIAIGPYHRLNPSLIPMEDHKLLYLENFLQYNQNYRLEDYIKRVKSWEGEARSCYDKKINLNSDQFVEMILLDGIFVIQLLLMYCGCQGTLPNDQIFHKPWMFNDVWRDMTLLENQMPFFVVQQLFEMAFGTHQQDMPELLELVCECFKEGTRMDKLPESVMKLEVKHLTHVISLSFLPSVRKASDQNLGGMKFPPSAMELVTAGVKLRRSDSKCLFDIEFKNGELKIPVLALFDRTESLFRNMIAFEQCYHLDDSYLIDYMAFMNYLVNTSGDAKLLIDEGIIENWLSNEASVVQLFKSLGVETQLPENYYFNGLSHELINHCQRPCNKWKATFKRDYCSSPWVAISVIAAVVLLALTVAQTVCSFISLKNLTF